MKKLMPLFGLMIVLGPFAGYWAWAGLQRSKFHITMGAIANGLLWAFGPPLLAFETALLWRLQHAAHLVHHLP